MGVGILKVVVLRSEGVERVKIVNIMVIWKYGMMLLNRWYHTV